MSGAVPELRFPGFEEAWTEQKLSSVLKSKGRRNTDLHFGPENVLSVSGELGVVNQIEHLGRSYAGASVAPYHVVETGDVVYTKSPLKTKPFGIIKTNRGASGIVSTLYAVYEVRDGHDPIFWDRYFELDDRTNRYLKPLVNKGAKNDMKISNERVLIDPVIAPGLSEQQKIAAFLDTVSRKIALLGEKKGALTDYKRGLMQRLFSRELRFRRDDGSAFPAWQERRLGNVARFFKGKGISKADILEDGALPCIRYGEIYTHYHERISEVISRTNEDPKTLFLSKPGDVIIPASGEDRMDMARACCVELGGVALGGDINVLRSSVDGDFLAYYLNNARRREIANLGQGVSVVHLYPSQLQSLTVEIPHPDEQRKIAAALSVLDAKIDATARKISELEAFKKGLLQKLFV